MTHSDKKSAEKLHEKEKEEWKENREEANATNLNEASPALKQDALTKTKKSVEESNLSDLDKDDLPKPTSETDDRG